MLTGAPPMLVVGLALHALWIPISALLRLADSGIAMRLASMSFVMYFVGIVMVLAGELELARRTRGRVRTGMALALVADGFVLASVTVVTLATPHWMYRHELFGDAYRWGYPIANLVAVLGLAVAVGRRHLVAAMTTFAVVGILFPLPPIASLITERIAIGNSTIVVFGALMAVRSIGLARLANLVGVAAAPVRRDHLRGARGLWWAAIASTLRALALLAVLGFIIADGDGNSKSAMAVVAFEMVAMVALLKACWTIAQAQLETLSRYLVHVATAVVLGSILASVHVFAGMYEVATLGDEIDLRVPVWVELGGTLTTAWLIVVLGRYARRAHSLVRLAVGCGGTFTALSCAGLAIGRPGVSAALGAVANAVMIPLFVKAARQVADDPVKTTADVFA